MEEKSMKKSFSSLGWRFLIGTLIIYAVQMVVGAIVGLVKPEWLENTDHVLCIDVLRQPGGNTDHYGSRRTERLGSR